MAWARTSRTRLHTVAVAALLGLCAVLSSCGGNGGKTGVALIIKTQTNPYFVSMKQAALAQATRQEHIFTSPPARLTATRSRQINAIDTAIARGDKGILITSNGPAVNAALRQAKDYGLFVIALDTPLDPAKTADITYATNNFKAGKLVGAYARSGSREEGRHRDARPV